MVMEKSWNMKNCRKVIEFQNKSWNFTNVVPEFCQIWALFANINFFYISLEVLTDLLNENVGDPIVNFDH